MPHAKTPSRSVQGARSMAGQARPTLLAVPERGGLVTYQVRYGSLKGMVGSASGPLPGALMLVNYSIISITKSSAQDAFPNFLKRHGVTTLSITIFPRVDQGRGGSAPSQASRIITQCGKKGEGHGEGGLAFYKNIMGLKPSQENGVRLPHGSHPGEVGREKGRRAA